MAKSSVFLFVGGLHVALAGAGVVLAAAPSATYADPPSWAPAHGWRRKHDEYYSGYTGTRWDRDYGIISGRCDRQAIGAVLGAAVGGAIGSQVGKGTGNEVATVLGVVIGSAVGAKVGGDLDSVDRACVGHALELAQDKERVSWGNPTTGATYVLSPVRGYQQDGRTCREFSLRVTTAGQSQNSLSLACQSANGTWQSARREDSRVERHGRRGRDERDRD